MAYALVSNVGFASGGAKTSTAIDTTGASLLIAHVSSYAGNPQPTLSDSKSNIWTGLTVRAGSIARSRLFYVLNPTVGSAHTFSLGGGSYFGTLQVAAFSGAETTAPFDVENGATGTGASIQTGSVTPNQNDSLIVTGVCPSDGQTGTINIDSSFVITDRFSFQSGTNEGGALAYLVQTSAAAVNPSWSWTGSVEAAATIAVFKPAAGGGDPGGDDPVQLIKRRAMHGGLIGGRLVN